MGQISNNTSAYKEQGGDTPGLPPMLIQFSMRIQEGFESKYLKLFEN